jgi:hypothetical protein
MTPLKFDTLEFTRQDDGKARIVITADVAVALEALHRTGNGLGAPGTLASDWVDKTIQRIARRPVILAPMEIGEDDDHE